MNRKATAALIGALCLCLGLLAVPRERSLAADQTGTVVVDSTLNVRDGAGTDHNKVAALPNGTKVTILDTANDKNGTKWYKISATVDGEKITGYVSSSYIAIEKDTSEDSASDDTSAEPTATPSGGSSGGSAVTYRTETVYEDISVPAKTSDSAKVYKGAAKKYLKVSGQIVVLPSNKKVTIIGEKAVGTQKWFKISFKYKKKAYEGFLMNDYVKMTLSKKAYAAISKEKDSVKVREKAGSGSAAVKSGGKTVKLKKKTAVEIDKEKTVKKAKWYRIRFTYNDKSCKGFINSRYVNLAKKAVVKKVPVIAMSEAEFEEELKKQGFPDSYKQSLRALHDKYPYWQFQAYRPGVDWTKALDAECKLGVNLISNSKSKAWKSLEEGAYDEETGKWTVFDGSTWVAASREAIAYYMDPRNFLSERTVFQFELLEYQPQYQVAAGVDQILNNTPFSGKSFSYKDLKTGEEKTITYTKAFLAAAEDSGVSPYHLASRVKQEVVTSATTASDAVSGTNEKYPGIYNFYNIGATSSQNPILNGLKWANSGSTYLRPWTDPYRSIVGGGQYIGTSYINKGYLQKFNLTENGQFEHQYMTNVEAAYSEAIKTKNAYADTMDSTPIVFSIPIYENMPDDKCPAPQ